MPSLAFAGDKIIAEIERRAARKVCLRSSLIAIPAPQFASMQRDALFLHTDSYML